MLYLSLFISLFAAILVISAANPVHSVLALILVFVNGTLQFVSIGADYLALTLLVVYVGALSILFLFVVMMLNIRLTELTEDKTQLLPVGALICVLFLIAVWPSLRDFSMNLSSSFLDWTNWMDALTSRTSLQIIGELLYSHGLLWLWLSGLVLLLALIGALVLTLDHERDIKRQDLFSQTAR